MKHTLPNSPAGELDAQTMKQILLTKSMHKIIQVFFYSKSLWGNFLCFILYHWKIFLLFFSYYSSA